MKHPVFLHWLYKSPEMVRPIYGIESESVEAKQPFPLDDKALHKIQLKVLEDPNSPTTYHAEYLTVCDGPGTFSMEFPVELATTQYAVEYSLHCESMIEALSRFRDTLQEKSLCTECRTKTCKNLACKNTIEALRAAIRFYQKEARRADTTIRNY